ncbi:MAG: TolC family protein [Verrucomicrobiota bacterium]
MKTQNLNFRSKCKPWLTWLALYLLIMLPLQAADNINQNLNINQALARALVSNPSLNLFDQEMRMAEARVLTASLLLNPQLETELEDFGGSGAYSGTDSATYNVGLSQLFRLGGKRRAGMAQKTAEKKALALTYEVRKRLVSEEVGRRFVGVLKAQQMEQNRKNILSISEESAKAVKAKVEGGRGSSINLNQAELSVMNARLSYQTAAQRTNIARIQLAALWNKSEVDFKKAVGFLSAPPAQLRSLAKYQDSLQNHPDLELAEASLQLAHKSLGFQKSQRVPNLRLGLGYRRDSSIDESALVLGASLPLPLFNRNQGGIAEAKASIDRGTQQRSNAFAGLQVRLSQAYSELAVSHMASRLIVTELMPKARDSFKATEESHRLGRTTYLQLLVAQRNLTAIIERQTEAFAQFHQARITIEALTGKTL